MRIEDIVIDSKYNVCYWIIWFVCGVKFFCVFFVIIVIVYIVKIFL